MSGLRVHARGLSKRFGVVRALQGLDLTISPGDSLAVLGPNGAGKSTLLQLLAGLSRPTEGKLSAEPEDGPALTRDALRGRVGYLGHATLLYAELSARENLAFAARLDGVTGATARIDELLGETGLTHVADRRTGDFSRGMAQRLAIGRALVHDPELLLLDEPFTGLDERAAERLAALLARLSGEGRTVVTVTHDLARAAQISTRAIVLSRGQLIETCEGPDLDRDGLSVALRRALESDAEGAGASGAGTAGGAE